MKKLDAPTIALIAALIVGAVVRLWNLGAQSLYLDEGFSVLVASKPWPQMMHQIVYGDFHPPLFYALAHAAIGRLHWQVWNYRYLTAPFGLITIAATWAIARRLFGDVAAIIAAVLAAFEPAIIEWDRLFRMYGLMAAIASLSWWLLLAAPEKKGRAAWFYWTAYGITAIMLPYIQYMGAFDVLCQGAYAAVNLRRRWPALAWDCAAAIALVPWLPSLSIQYPNGGLVAGNGIVPIHWATLVRDWLLSGAPHAWSEHDAFVWGLTGFVITVGIAAACLAPRSILPYWLAVAVLQVSATIVTGKSLVVARYLLHAAPAVVVALSGVTAWLFRTKARAVGLTAAVAVPAVFAVCTANIVWDPYYQFSDWYLVNLVVLQHERPSDAMVFVQNYPYIIVGDFSAFRNHPAGGPSSPSDLPEVLRWIRAHPSRRVWYIENQFFFADPDKKVKALLDKTRKRLGVWSENKADGGSVVNIVLYDVAQGRSAQRSARRTGLHPLVECGPNHAPGRSTAGATWALTTMKECAVGYAAPRGPTPGLGHAAEVRKTAQVALGALISTSRN